MYTPFKFLRYIKTTLYALETSVENKKNQNTMFQNIKTKIFFLLGIPKLKTWTKTHEPEVRIALLVSFLLVMIYQLFEFVFSRSAFESLVDGIRGLIESISQFTNEIRKYRSILEMLEEQARLDEKLQTIIAQNQTSGYSHWENTKVLCSNIFQEICKINNIWLKMMKDVVDILTHGMIHTINYTYQNLPGGVVILFKLSFIGLALWIMAFTTNSFVTNVPLAWRIPGINWINDSMCKPFLVLITKGFEALPSILKSRSVNTGSSGLRTLNESLIRQNKSLEYLNSSIKASLATTAQAVGALNTQTASNHLMLAGQIGLVTACVIPATIHADVLSKAFQTLLEVQSVLQTISSEQLVKQNIDLSCLGSATPETLNGFGESLLKIRDKFLTLFQGLQSSPQSTYQNDFTLLKELTDEIRNNSEKITNMNSNISQRINDYLIERIPCEIMEQLQNIGIVFDTVPPENTGPTSTSIVELNPSAGNS